jgi:hypothetical protein
VNRVLSLPHTTIVPGLLDTLKSVRSRTRITPKGMIRFELSRGPVEMRLVPGQPPIDPGTEVYVWWKGGGFVCAPSSEVDAAERRTRSIERRVIKARETLAAARADRWARLSSYGELPASEPAPLDQTVSIY